MVSFQTWALAPFRGRSPIVLVPAICRNPSLPLRHRCNGNGCRTASQVLSAVTLEQVLFSFRPRRLCLETRTGCEHEPIFHGWRRSARAPLDRCSRSEPHRCRPSRVMIRVLSHISCNGLALEPTSGTRSRSVNTGPSRVLCHRHNGLAC